jgi:hypothetical protein
VASLFYFLFCFILVYFHNAHQVLAGLPQGVGGLAGLFVFIFYYFILVHCHNTHHVRAGLPQGVGGLAILFYFSLFL